jgi:hypothetical protein
MSTVTRAAKMLLPRYVLDLLRRRQFRNSINLYNRGLTIQEIFTRIYTERIWGQSTDPSDKYYSGTGSRDDTIVQPYIDSVSRFLRSFEVKPNVVDVGCGDFFVGSQLRALCGSYIACDIVAPLIDFNKEKYKSLNVDFRVLDLTKDELPHGDILFIRQVLQHLSNKQIKRALPGIAGKFKYLIVTEHLPASESFTHNLDIPGGALFRLPIQSGVVVTSSPFNLSVKGQRTLCQGEEAGGIIKTTLYDL